MSPERYQQIKVLFLEALERPAEVRSTFVIARTQNDALLRAEVEQLLVHHREGGDEPRMTSPVPEPLRTRAGVGAASAKPADEPTRAAPLAPEDDAGGTRYHGLSEAQAGHAEGAGAAAGSGSVGGGGAGVGVGDRASVVPPPGVGGAGGAGPRTQSRMRIDYGRFAPGTLLVDRYRIVELIARGGMGEVYRADDLKLGEAVALKFLPANLASNPDWLERFLDEVRAARNVAHPNVCRVYDVEEVRGEHFISMEYVDGETMSSLMSRIGRMPLKKAGELAQQLCAGLSAIHDRGIVHRDLKPANLMIDQRGQLKVTDFGLAVPGEVKGYQAAAGTPGYVAPEALAGTEATARSDIYALGLVLYELFTGVPAYPHRPGTDLIKQQTRTDPPAPSAVAPDIRPGVERAILACLERDPKDRPASARQVAMMLPGADPLAAALQAGETPSPSLVALSGREGILRWWEAAAVFLVFLSVLAAGLSLAGRASLVRLAPLELSSEVLADRARQALAALGYDRPIEHQAYALDLYEELLGEMERRDAEAFVRIDEQVRSERERLAAQGRTAEADAYAAREGPRLKREAAALSLARLKRERPAPIDFWYRTGGFQSPSADRGGRPPRQNPLWTQKATGVITMSDPPFNDAGMIAVRLTPKGKLRELVALDPDTYWPRGAAPEQPPPVGPPAPPADFAKLFELAGLDQTKFRAVAPVRIPPVFADTRVAWEGVYPESIDELVRVEAASLNGRVVAFRTVETRYPLAQKVAPQEPPGGQALSQALGAILAVLVLGGAAVLARRNVTAHRGDFQGAWRSAFAAGLATLLTLGLGADTLRGDDWRFQQLPWIAGATVLGGMVIWVLYIAVEPIGRRVWPEVLVSWSRLIMGRWLDPLVGQSLLVGATLGAAGIVSVYLRVLFPGWLGMPPARPFYEPQIGISAVNGVRDALSQLFKCALLAIQAGVVPLVAVVLLKLVVRRGWLALAIMGAVQAVIWGVYSPSTWASWVLFTGVSALALLVLVRYGVLALISSAFVYYVGVSSPITLEPARIGPTGLVVLCAMVGIALYGGVTSVIGKAQRAE